MKKNSHTYSSFTDLLVWCLLCASLCNTYTADAQTINISAGPDTTICYGSNLSLAILDAMISGDVDDGTWFTMGDGLFIPSNSSTVQFSLAQQYQPGPSDLSSGGFNLILVSDDPDGLGPMTEVSDIVNISLMTPPPMVCNGTINASLSESCTQEVDVFMLMANPQPPFEMYEITLYDENGDTISDNILTNDHVGQQMTFTVGHSCTSNICTGDITASDNIAPFLNCINTDVICNQGENPEITGFPVPFFATVSGSGPNYEVENFDACGTVILSYTDSNTPLNCSGGLIKSIQRQWTAVDPNGNSHTCVQVISVEAVGLDSVIAPPNYDNIDSMALACNGAWPALPNGYPDPVYTGAPQYGGCSNIETNYTDLYFEQCGAGFKVVRQWLVVDWCTSQSIYINQILKVIDDQGPIFDCPSDTIIGADAYSCVNAPFQAIFMDSVIECSSWDFSIAVLDANGIDQSNAFVDGLMLQNMPVGTYTLDYILTDECDNTNICTSNIEVIDDKVPFAICDEFTTVSVQNTGVARLYATSVDEASYDNCGISNMLIRKMTDQCGTGTAFAPFVDFCCGEVGETIMVEFEVTDINGLSNTCMVEVTVEDKIPAEIFCPSDLTISCDYLFDEDDMSVFGSVVDGAAARESIIIFDSHNNGFAGTDGYYVDNCGAGVEETAIVNQDCMSGSILRTFTVTDSDGTTSSCTQSITILNDNLFTGDDITWPANYSENGCDTLDANPYITGRPSLAGSVCSMAESTFEDQTFLISGGSCVKILRYWTVIDWCQFDNTPGSATWTYIQEIKLFNTVAPTFGNCSDKEICDLDDCGTHELVDSIIVSDDCTATEILAYQWSLDLDDNGIVDFTGTGNKIMQTVPYGMHRVFWSVTDGCSNNAACDYLINVKDCKLPTPYCENSFVTTLMPSAGSITISAESYDLGSEDNCTSRENLQFSFSQDISVKELTFTCDDITNGIAEVINLQMWVTDEQGNQDYCSIQIVLQDNSDICPDGNIKGRIAGKVATRSGYQIPEAIVRYDCLIDDYDGVSVTNETGGYDTGDIPEYLPYGVRPSYQGGLRNDVNSIDLVFIQRHILGLDTLETPYDIIAADVTKNDRIQASDLLLIRKFILGILDEFPKAQKWDFVPANYVFQDSLDPFGYIDSVRIDLLEDELDTIDFIAIRMGNVNGAYNFAGDDIIDGRSGEAYQLEYTSEEIEGEFKTIFKASGELLYDAFQLSLEVPFGKILSLESEILTEADYHILDGKVNIANLQLGSRLEEGAEIFTLRSTDKVVQLTSEDKYDQMIVGENIKKIAISEVREDAKESSLELNILSNPFVSDLHVSYSMRREQDATLNIYSLDGNLIYSQAVFEQAHKGISSSYFAKAGAYLVELKTADKSIVEKIVKL